MNPAIASRIIGGTILTAGVGIAAVTAHESITKDVPVGRTIQMTGAAMTAIGIGAAHLLPESSPLFLAALGAASLGALTFLGTEFVTN